MARLVSAARWSLESVLHSERLARAMVTPLVGAGAAVALDFWAVLMVMAESFHSAAESQPEM